MSFFIIYSDSFLIATDWSTEWHCYQICKTFLILHQLLSNHGGERFQNHWKGLFLKMYLLFFPVNPTEMWLVSKHTPVLFWVLVAECCWKHKCLHICLVSIYFTTSHFLCSSRIFNAVILNFTASTTNASPVSTSSTVVNISTSAVASISQVKLGKFICTISFTFV